MKRGSAPGKRMIPLSVLLGISLLCIGCAVTDSRPSKMVADYPMAPVVAIEVAAPQPMAPVQATEMIRVYEALPPVGEPAAMPAGHKAPQGAGVGDTPSSHPGAASVLVIKATGSGASQGEARADALSSLSSTLYTQVKSSLEVDDRVVMADGKVMATASNFFERINVSTDLPILGATVQTTYDGNRLTPLYYAEAEMSSLVSLPLYEQELERLAHLINSVDLTSLDDGDSLLQERQLLALLGYHDQYERHAYVARALGTGEYPPLSHSRYTLELKIGALARVNDSYAKAAQSLVQGVDKSGVYVYPPKLDGRGSVTEFAEQLAWAMQDALGSRSTYNADRASYFMEGSYTLVNDGRGGIIVSFRLEDGKGTVITTSMASLLPAVYEGQRFIPTAFDFQKQLERGEAVDTSFKAEIRINGKTDYLSFHRGDELVIEAKANQMCYFYIVGYVFNDTGERFAYLFPLKFDAVGKDMFVHRVSADQVGQWIIINPTWKGSVLPIEIIEPYGLEALQLYASTERDYQRFLETVPPFRETREYYVISEDPLEGLTLTRALNIKGVADSAAREIVKTEASVMFKTGR